MKSKNIGDTRKARKGLRWLIVILLVVLLVTPLSYMFAKGWFAVGNSAEYSVSKTETLPENALTGKTIVFLGSSVTLGDLARNESFSDYLQIRNDITAYKEAVSGTTIVDNGDNSYISRLRQFDTDVQVDAFICQLSTNDASKKLPLGEISADVTKEKFDTSTVTGSMEYIIAYVQETWNCPVIFYTGTKYDSPEYEAMVVRLLELQEKWDVTVIDLWNDVEMNAISAENYKLYMFDDIHPTRAGYREWWTPKFETALLRLFEE